MPRDGEIRLYGGPPRAILRRAESAGESSRPDPCCPDHGARACLSLLARRHPAPPASPRRRCAPPRRSFGAMFPRAGQRGCELLDAPRASNLPSSFIPPASG